MDEEPSNWDSSNESSSSFKIVNVSMTSLMKQES